MAALTHAQIQGLADTLWGTPGMIEIAPDGQKCRVTYRPSGAYAQFDLTRADMALSLDEFSEGIIGPVIAVLQAQVKKAASPAVR